MGETVNDNKSAPSQPRARASRAAVITHWLRRLAVVLLTAMLLGRFGGGWWWGCDLFNHFWPYYGLGLIVSMAWFAGCRARLECAWTFIGLCWNLTALTPYYLPQPPVAGETIRILVCNLFAGNPSPEEPLKLIASSGADMLVLLEVNHEWAALIQSSAIRQRYPYGKVLPRPGAFGMALLSRRPLANIEQVDFGLSGIATLVATDAEGNLQIVATHPPPPIGSRYAAARDRQLAELALYVAQSGRPTIVAGDLNATPWSTPFRRLCATGQVRDSSLGRGLHPTWPSWGMWSVLPIDHVLLTTTLGVQDRRVVPNPGSDHRAVLADIVVPRD